MPIHKCKKCTSKFYVKLSHVKMGYGKYCSRLCHHEGMKKRILAKCFICEGEIYRTKARLKNSKSEKYFCNKSCQTKWRNTVFMGENHKNWKNGESTYRDILIRSKVPQICKLCKNIDKRVLVARHIDQNRKNNRLDNLTWLCHNCHHEIHYDKLVK